MPKVMVKDIQLSQQIQDEFLVSNIEVRKTTRGSTFVSCTLGDKSGSVAGVMWDAEGKIPTPGIYSVAGTCNDYRGRHQVKIDSIGPRTSTTDENFLAVSKYSTEEMWGQICGFIGAMENTQIKNVAQDLMLGQGLEEGFKSSPAATAMHHAFVGGLLEHTSQMCQTVDTLFQLPFYAEVLNKDLCMFGVLFHDFCKILEYSHTAGFKKTIQGILVPHIPMMGAMVFESCNKFGVPEIIRDHLMHIILAHHGCMEYGSPVNMATPEAAFVHHIDNLHGDVFGWIQKIEANDQSEHIWHVDRTLVTTRFNEVLKSCTEATTTDTPSS